MKEFHRLLVSILFVVCAGVVGYQAGDVFTSHELTIHSLTVLCGAIGFLAIIITDRVFFIAREFEKNSLMQEKILLALNDSNQTVANIVKAQADLLSEAAK